MLKFVVRPYPLIVLPLVFIGCNPDFSELSRGQSAIDGGGGAASAGMKNMTGRAGAATAGDTSESGAPNGGGADPEGGGTDSGGADSGGADSGGADSSGGASGTGDGQAGTGNGGATSEAGSAGLNQAGGGGRGDNSGGGSSGSGHAPSSPVASASTEESGPGNVAANALDGSSGTKWCASDGSVPQWWQVDLQVMTAFSGVSIEFESALAYPYQLQVSSDGKQFSAVLDRSNNSSTSQVQSESVAAHGRYVRVGFSALPPADPWPHWACIREFGLLGATPDPADSVAGLAGSGG